MEIATVIPVATFVLLWIGTAVWLLARINAMIKIMEDELKRMRSDIDDMEKWGTEQIKERAAFNENHYLSIERFNECQNDWNRRLQALNAVDISAKLASMEGKVTQLSEQMTLLLNAIIKK